MFHKLLRYSATSIGQRGLCSLQFSSSTKVAQVNLAFWSGNVYNSLCLSEFPNSLQTAPNSSMPSLLSLLLQVIHPLCFLCSVLMGGSVKHRLLSWTNPHPFASLLLPAMKIYTRCSQAHVSKSWTAMTYTAFYSFF